jgi:signal peptidase I
MASNHLAAPGGLLAGPAVAPAVQPQPPTTAKPTKPDEPKDPYREVVETIVFVIVLVILLRMFVAEAFVIPTGSMAETLWGYQKWVTCDQCGHQFAINCSEEVDPPEGRRINQCTCPNCRNEMQWEPNLGPSVGSGDRVLVTKFPFDDNHLGTPNRHDVVVFKFPDGPAKLNVPINYIKRLVGLPGETIAISNGDVFVATDVAYPPVVLDGPGLDPKVATRQEMFRSHEEAINRFKAGKFAIIRKTPEKMLAMRRLVFDNDHLAKDLLVTGQAKPRWEVDQRDGQPTWANQFSDLASAVAHGTKFTHKAGPNLDWLKYQHYLYPRSKAAPPKLQDPQPQEITTFMGYNQHNGQGKDHASYWVGDLMVECFVNLPEPTGQLILELAKGIDRFQARFDLATGLCQLVRLTRQDDGSEVETLLGQPTATKLHQLTRQDVRLRLANFDERLTLWVNNALPFAAGLEYPRASKSGMVLANDRDRPVRIGAANSTLTISHLQVWRDTYYLPTTNSVQPDLATYYVQPGHYLCLGDNSSQSSDSRHWGLVPERLLLGRAVMVYWPLHRFGVIR